MEPKLLAKSLAFVVASIFMLLGVAAAVFPDIVMASGRHMVSPAGILAAAAVRIGIGLALLLIARESRAPGILRIMGWALLVMGLAMPFLGVDSARARLDWEAEHTTFLRMEGVLFVWAGFIVLSLARSPA
jgi:hypothetical protein